MKHMALGTVSILMTVVWVQFIYHRSFIIIYLSFKSPTDCAVDVEVDRQLMAVKLIK